MYVPCVGTINTLYKLRLCLQCSFPQIALCGDVAFSFLSFEAGAFASLAQGMGKGSCLLSQLHPVVFFVPLQTTRGRVPTPGKRCRKAQSGAGTAEPTGAIPEQSCPVPGSETLAKA